MNVQSLLAKLKGQSQQGHHHVALLQPDAIYFASSTQHDQPAHVEPINSSWEKSLAHVLQLKVTPGQRVSIVLASHHYQIFQLDKPAIPRSEWPAALPFLVKDLISERVSDIVADGRLLPGDNKIQVYVLAKKVVDKIVDVLLRNQCELDAIIPEDEVWAHSAGELANFILLQRSHKGQFKLGAFVDYTPTFQRTIRSVYPPLTGESASALQLDGLALELQRSMDYLSSQLKGVTLNQLKICCDDEDQNALVASLSERLTASTSLIASSALQCGQIVVNTALSLGSPSVNLYPQHLRPKRDRFNLTTLVASWLLAALVLGGMYGLARWQQAQLAQELAVAQAQSQQFKQQLAAQQAKLAAHKPAAEKLAAVERLKQQIQATQASLAAVGNYDQSRQGGYSEIMQALAKLGRNDISLSDIYITHDRLDLKGVARSASVVPNWVNQFKQEVSLVGRNFEKVRLGRNEQDVITFELRTRAEGK
ncbi:MULTISPECIES: MSHA biogenesis protein MshI [Vibrio]|uniref:MSHA biogenesis protein MshI n=1 Tax=Vibrio TaxID=662 RepID=UPI0005ED9AC4|nr:MULTISPECIES: MSHA biogenesis protein MshI [Vibrio]KJR23822.1 MSHA biogenesis protein MshI [Vibrio sp. S234-5]MBE3653158.1 MSHA biogenesis protein MshI [Vibrio navarrensis]